MHTIRITHEIRYLEYLIASHEIKDKEIISHYSFTIVDIIDTYLGMLDNRIVFMDEFVRVLGYKDTPEAESLKDTAASMKGTLDAIKLMLVIDRALWERRMRKDDLELKNEAQKAHGQPTSEIAK